MAARFHGFPTYPSPIPSMSWLRLNKGCDGPVAKKSRRMVLGWFRPLGALQVLGLSEAIRDGEALLGKGSRAPGVYVVKNHDVGVLDQMLLE
eukprot:2404928-Pyramimonas_sp.AAC.1